MAVELNKEVIEEAPSTLARNARLAGDLERLNSICSKACADVSLSHLELVRVGIEARDAGEFAAAEHCFAEAVKRDAGLYYAHFEEAISLMYRGMHAEAIRCLETVPDEHQDNARVNLLAARLNASVGALDEAKVRLNRVPQDDPSLALERNFVAFLGRYPLNRALQLARSRTKQRPDLDPDGVLQAVNEALAQKRGFALVRLGDGEGSFMFISDRDEAEFECLHAFNRNQFATIWYGGNPPENDPALRSTLFAVNQTATWADVVGVPYDTWIEHEYRILSCRGIFGLVNVFRGLAPGLSHGAFCQQNIALAMALDGRLESLLTGRQSLGLISCHHELPSALQRRFGVGEVEFYKLPAEKGRADIFGKKADGIHFPDAYRKTLAALEKPHNGRLFLVAGGILGKFYCKKIKEFGGVALDIGSVADAWMGAQSRTGFPDTLVL